MRIPACLSCVLIACSASAVHAFKIDTHVWIASQLWQEINETNGRLRIPGVTGVYQMDKPVVSAIRAHRGAFVLGVLGPDTYPDMVAGQMTTHPGVRKSYQHGNQTRLAWQTDDWLRFVRDQAIASGDPAALAFAYGYMLHAAMDTWAHTYVNLYVGEVFSIAENQEAAERHVALESYIKSLHTSLIEAEGTSSAKAQRRLQAAVGRPGTLARSKPDLLSSMHVPAAFVRDTLILNETVARQYALEDATFYLKGMYDYWIAVKSLPATAAPLRMAFNDRYDAFVGLVEEAEAVFAGAELVKTNAETTATETLDRLRGAEAALNGAATEFSAVALGFLASAAAQWDQLKIIREARKLIATTPSNLRGPLQQLIDAEAALSVAENAVTQARQARSNALAALRTAVVAARTAGEDLDLKQFTLDTLDAGRTIAIQISDTALNQWRANVEAAVEAYVVAWQDTSKELMRPPGKRFTAGNDPAGPLKRWAICWGPALGLVAHPLAQSGCTNLLFQHGQIMEQVSLLPRQLFLPESVRSAVENFEESVHEAVLLRLTSLGGQLAPVLQVDEDKNLSGFGLWLVRMWDKHTTAADLDQVYSDDTSGKGLVTYAQLHTHILNDIGVAPDDPRLGELTLADLGQFAPIANAVTLSKLTLLGGQALNSVARSWTLPVVDKGQTGKSTQAKNAAVIAQQASAMGAMMPDLYPPKAPAGVVLLGALRSIDGDHQWLDVAPGLPRSAGPMDNVCRRYGYPAPNAGYADDCPSSEDPIWAEVLNLKGGFRFWQHPLAREHVFLKMFAGPVTRSLCDATGHSDLPAHGIGCGASDPFPVVAAAVQSPQLQPVPRRIAPQRRSTRKIPPKASGRGVTSSIKDKSAKSDSGRRL